MNDLRKIVLTTLASLLTSCTADDLARLTHEHPSDPGFHLWEIVYGETPQEAKAQMSMPTRRPRPSTAVRH